MEKIETAARTITTNLQADADADADAAAWDAVWPPDPDAADAADAAADAIVVRGRQRLPQECDMLTLEEIREHSPCRSGWRKLLSRLGKTEADSEPLSLATIVQSNGFADAAWCLRALPAEMSQEIALLACDFADTAKPYTSDPRPGKCIEVTRQYLAGDATRSALKNAVLAVWAMPDHASRTSWLAARAAVQAGEAALAVEEAREDAVWGGWAFSSAWEVEESKGVVEGILLRWAETNGL